MQRVVSPHLSAPIRPTDETGRHFFRAGSPVLGWRSTSVQQICVFCRIIDGTAFARSAAIIGEHLAAAGDVMSAGGRCTRAVRWRTVRHRATISYVL